MSLDIYSKKYLKLFMFHASRQGWRDAVKTAQNNMSPNGRLYAKHGRGQPGRAPCLGGALRRSSAEPRGAQGFTRRARTGLLGEVYIFCLNQLSPR
jgi:hypothetical protein